MRKTALAFLNLSTDRAVDIQYLTFHRGENGASEQAIPLKVLSTIKSFGERIVGWCQCHIWCCSSVSSFADSDSMVAGSLSLTNFPVFSV